jgi:hypothetical protein
MTKRTNKHYPAEFKQEAVASVIDQDYPIEQAAAKELTQLVPDTQYFPAFEIVTGPQAPESYFQDDRREPSSEAIDMVMATLLSKCDVSSNQHEKVDFGFSYQESINLADAISDYDCEEAASGC